MGGCRLGRVIGEAELVQTARAGDADAFAALVERHQDYLYHLALRTLGNAEEAEDLAQEVFIRAWLALPRFRGQSGFRTWLYRIAINLCYNRLPGLRREMARVPADDLGEIPDGAPCPAIVAEEGERRRLLQRAIDVLPTGFRLLVTLRYQHGMAYEEIASLLRLPLGTVKTGLHRAHSRLREVLRRYEEDRM